MHEPNSELYLEVAPQPDAQTTLACGVVLAQADRSVTARFRADDVHVPVGSTLRMYYDREHRFSMQLARLLSAAPRAGEGGREPAVDLALAPVGEAVPVDRRDSYRVLVYGGDLTVAIGGEIGCRVLDVSRTGLSAVAASRHDIGAVVKLEMLRDGARCEGIGSVQSAISFGRNTTRYGIYVPDVGELTLAPALALTTLELQRQQLARLAALR